MSSSKFTAFDRDGETVTAIPESPDDDEVEFDATIADRDEEDAGKGNWEDLIGQMFEYDDGQAVEFDGTSASLSSRDAISAVVESDDEFVMTRHQAEAVLEYLNSEEILDIADTGSVTVLKSFESIEESGAFQMCNNWAAMFDTAVGQVETASEKLEQLSQNSDSRKPAPQQQESAMYRFEVLKTQMMERRNEFRKIAMTEAVFPGEPEAVFPQDLVNISDQYLQICTLLPTAITSNADAEDLVKLSDQYSDIMISMGNALSPEEKMESTSDDEFADEILAQAEETVEQPDEGTEALDKSITPDEEFANEIVAQDEETVELDESTEAVNKSRTTDEN